MSDLTGKDLAIKVAEKLGEASSVDMFHRLASPMKPELFADKYLRQKAAEILFQEGMAWEIGSHVWQKVQQGGIGAGFEAEWWRTLTPEKVLNVWLEI